MVATTLITYLTENIGFSSSLAGVVAGLFSITALVCRPICGIMSDRVNKVKLIRVATFLMVLGIYGYTVTDAKTMIIIFRIAHGVGFAINSTALVSLAVEFIPKDRLGEGVGYYGLANVIASAVAPGAGVNIANRYGNRTVFYIAGIVSIGALLIMLFAVKPAEKKRKTKAVKKDIKLSDIFIISSLVYTAIGATFSFSNGVISSYLMPYAKVLGLDGVGLYFTINALTLFLIRPLAGKLFDKRGLYCVVYPAMIISIFSMIILATLRVYGSSIYLMLLFSSLLRAVGQGAGQPSLQTYCIMQAGNGKTGAATSTFYLGGDVGQGIGPMIAGSIVGFYAGTTGYSIIFCICASLLLLGFIALVFLKKSEESISRESSVYTD